MRNKDLARSYASFAMMLCLFIAASPALAGESFGEIAARIGEPIIIGGQSWHPSGDVNGQVGYPLEIDGPGFNCPSGWTASMTVDSGTLPPGMSLQDNGHITGTPTERGHWPVVMKLDNIRCNGRHYDLVGFTDVFVNYMIQQGFTNFPASVLSECAENESNFCNLTTIRFHITGTGAVH